MRIFIIPDEEIILIFSPITVAETALAGSSTSISRIPANSHSSIFGLKYCSFSSLITRWSVNTTHSRLYLANSHFDCMLSMVISFSLSLSIGPSHLFKNLVPIVAIIAALASRFISINFASASSGGYFTSGTSSVVGGSIGAAAGTLAGAVSCALREYPQKVQNFSVPSMVSPQFGQVLLTACPQI